MTCCSAHPDVAEAAAFAVRPPAAWRGRCRGGSFEAGATVTSLELREFLLPSLAQFKIPRRIVFVDRLPKGATGKVQRQRLVEGLK